MKRLLFTFLFALSLNTLAADTPTAEQVFEANMIEGVFLNRSVCTFQGYREKGYMTLSHAAPNDSGPVYALSFNSDRMDDLDNNLNGRALNCSDRKCEGLGQYDWQVFASSEQGVIQYYDFKNDRVVFLGYDVKTLKFTEIVFKHKNEICIF